MKKYLLTILVIVITSLLVAACGGGGAAAPAAKPNTLTAIKTDSAALDANAGFWANAPKLEAATKTAKEGNPDGPTVTLQAAYDANNIVVRAEWADATESVMKSAWTWDGSAFTKSGDEDRIMFAWPIGNNAEFASKGCAFACHNTSDNPDEWWMGSDSVDVRYDNWHWKAARTNPVGYADDQWWNTLEDPADVESSRRSDAKDSGGYEDNINEEQTGPIFMSSKGIDVKFILNGEEVDLDTAALKTGAIIPGFALSKPVGSRGDVEAKGVWADGKWVVVIMRPLNTGHDDDATFTPSKPMPFGLSVVDNGGGVNHTVVPDVLTLDWK